MNYTEIELSISLEDAADIVSREVDNVRRTSEGGEIHYRVNSGATIAILRENRGAGRGETILRYRTTLLSPTMARARRKARSIKHALEEYRV